MAVVIPIMHLVAAGFRDNILRLELEVPQILRFLLFGELGLDVEVGTGGHPGHMGLHQVDSLEIKSIIQP